MLRSNKERGRALPKGVKMAQREKTDPKKGRGIQLNALNQSSQHEAPTMVRSVVVWPRLTWQRTDNIDRSAQLSFGILASSSSAIHCAKMSIWQHPCHSQRSHLESIAVLTEEFNWKEAPCIPIMKHRMLFLFWDWANNRLASLSGLRPTSSTSNTWD